MSRRLLPQKCCCCSLRTGSLIAAYYGATIDLIGLLVITTFYLGNPDKKLQESVSMSYRYYHISVTVILIVINFIVNIMLEVGVRKRSMGLIKTWIYFVGLHIVFGILLIIFNSVSGPIIQEPEQYISNVIIWIIQVLHISFFVIVYSFYEQLKFKRKYYTTVVPKILAQK